MGTGSCFRLNTQTLGIESADGKRVAVTLPAGAEIKVISAPVGNDRMVDVLWSGKIVAMFAQDVQERGEAIQFRSQGA
jgi:hypothetical protein